MFRRCTILAFVVSLAGASVALGGTFTDLSAATGGGGYTVYPTGVARVGSDVQVGGSFGSGVFNIPFIYTGGSMVNLKTSLGLTASTMAGTGINSAGQVAIYGNAQQSFSYSGGSAGSKTTISSVPNAMMSWGIDSYGDMGGSGNTGGGLSPMIVPGSVIAAAGAGGTVTMSNNYLLTRPYGTNSGINSIAPTSATSGIATGYSWASLYPLAPTTMEAIVWHYTISGGVVTTTSVSDPTAMIAHVLGLNIGGADAWGTDGHTGGMALFSTNSSAHTLGNWIPSPGYVTKTNMALGAPFLYDLNSSTAVSINLGGLILDNSNGVEGGSGYIGSLSQALNDNDQVVGKNAVGHAAVWSPAGTPGGVSGLYDLNTWAHANTSIPAGWTLNNAISIDNNGDIAGYGTNASGTANMGFVITGFPTPTPEPSTLLLAGMGLAGVLAYAWKQRK
jgi:hypothetical protein